MPRTAAAAHPPHAGGGPGSEVSLGQLLEHRLVQLRLREQLLQPGVLTLELLQPLRVVRLQPAVLGELANDLLRRMTTALGHGAVLLTPSWGFGLAHRVDHYKGVSSRSSKTESR